VPCTAPVGAFRPWNDPVGAAFKSFDIGVDLALSLSPLGPIGGGLAFAYERAGGSKALVNGTSVQATMETLSAAAQACAMGTVKECRAGSVDRLLTAIFLRIYARNLRRGWSGGVGRSWSDAIFSMLILVGFPVVGLSLALWHLAIGLFQKVIGASRIADSVPILILVITCFGLNLLLSRKMRVYRDEPIS